jgi:hypothetical protein
MSKAPAVAVVGDLHVNSNVGLLAPGCVMDEGQEIKLSVNQAWLWDCWLEYIDWLDQWDIKALVINGDLVQGINSRDAQIISVNEADQHKMLFATLEPLLYRKHKRRIQNIYITRGTGFHSGGAGSREEIIGKLIGAVQDHKGRYSRYENKIFWKQYYFFFTHHIGRSSVYELTPLQKAQKDWRLASYATGKRMPDVDVRTHLTFKAGDGKFTVVVPAWQFKNDFTFKVAPGASQPSIGGIVICEDEKERLTVESKTFALPEMETDYLTVPI